MIQINQIDKEVKPMLNLKSLLTEVKWLNADLIQELYTIDSDRRDGRISTAVAYERLCIRQNKLDKIVRALA